MPYASTSFSACLTASLHTSCPKAIFLMDWDLAIKSGCHLPRIISNATVSKSEICFPDFTTIAEGTSSKSSLSESVWLREFQCEETNELPSACEANLPEPYRLDCEVCSGLCAGGVLQQCLLLSDFLCLVSPVSVCAIFAGSSTLPSPLFYLLQLTPAPPHLTPCAVTLQAFLPSQASPAALGCLLY